VWLEPRKRAQNPIRPALLRRISANRNRGEGRCVHFEVRCYLHKEVAVQISVILEIDGVFVLVLVLGAENRVMEGPELVLVFGTFGRFRGKMRLFVFRRRSFTIKFL